MPDQYDRSSSNVTYGTKAPDLLFKLSSPVNSSIIWCYFFVDYEEKAFPDVKADPGEKALVTFHTVAFEGSIGLVNLLQALLITKR
ncbi:hypothetical protein C7B65_21005 [Phormidesmis priestleyi ULC007]|uniref:Uncharacterized protein n=1 Tax=Phormidesmis priestleyi ULC007 TaxID=1920490 RepID=A0A2T1D7Y2_9CYAN|nr:hypothetical protein [Phormidesmis priestleyi]PSB16610.1 hypothetical protein C7B65_21005 [Phormidesmis priestleyi ULC007]PZO47514.1 MAG: hypothetical protein DCF14_19540 [Phormidesmis priestleyi]